MGNNTTDIFVAHLFKMSQNKYNPIVIEQARLCLLDYKGVAMAGARILAERNQSFIDSVGRQGGGVSIIGHDVKTTLHNAAFINAINAHATELDDGHREGQIHLGASIISALLPVAELEGLNEDEILCGIIVGYEAAILLAMAMNPSHKLRGYHTSGTCGTIGTAMAIAAAMHFSLPQMKSALSAATSSAAGLLEMQEDYSELKPFNLAQAAVGGIVSAYCSLAGFKGPDDALGGKRGILSVMSENPMIDYLTSFKEGVFQIEHIYRKPYAACRHAHSAIEACLKLKENNSLDYLRIDSITIETYSMAILGHDHIEIKGIQSAKMSIPYSVALALIKGNAGLMDYSNENIKDSNILALAKKVEMVENPVFSSWVPQKRAAKVIIKTESKTYYYQVDYPKGEPENPMNEYEILKKFDY